MQPEIGFLGLFAFCLTFKGRRGISEDKSLPKHLEWIHKGHSKKSTNMWMKQNKCLPLAT